MSASGNQLIRYVIGTEVPVPGGAGIAETEMHVTTPAAVAETLDLTRAAFEAQGVADAWERVRFVVAQPGVEFSDVGVHSYERAAAVRSRGVHREPSPEWPSRPTAPTTKRSRPCARSSKTTSRC